MDTAAEVSLKMGHLRKDPKKAGAVHTPVGKTLVLGGSRVARGLDGYGRHEGFDLALGGMGLHGGLG